MVYTYIERASETLDIEISAATYLADRIWRHTVGPDSDFGEEVVSRRKRTVEEFEQSEYEIATDQPKMKAYAQEEHEMPSKKAFHGHIERVRGGCARFAADNVWWGVRGAHG